MPLTLLTPPWWLFRWTAGTDYKLASLCGNLEYSEHYFGYRRRPQFHRVNTLRDYQRRWNEHQLQVPIERNSCRFDLFYPAAASENYGQLLFCADNLNTANVCSATFFWSTLMLK